MQDVLLEGWSPGLKKVSLNALLREQAEMGARAAHEAVNSLMEGRTISVPFTNKVAAERFAKEAGRLGAKVRIVRSR